MSYLDSLLSMFDVKKGHKDPDVNGALSSISAMCQNEKYSFGTFLNRILKRIHLVDDFHANGIAYATYLTSIRKVSIVINPLMIWDHLLRNNILSDNKLKNKILFIDKLMLDSFKAGGWTEHAFKDWIEFISSPDLCASTHSDESKFKIAFMSVVVHELMHALWNHLSFARLSDNEAKEDREVRLWSATLSNIAQDFSINQTLDFGTENSRYMTVENEALLKLFKDSGAKMKAKNNDAIGYSSYSRRKVSPNAEITISEFDEIAFLNQPFDYYLSLLKKIPKDKVQKMLGGCSVGSSMFKINGGLYEYFKHNYEGMTEQEKKEFRDSLGTGGDGEEQFEDFNNMDSEAKKVMSNDLKRVIDDLLAKGEINDPSDICNQHPININKYFAKIVEGLYAIETFTWEQILAAYLKTAVGADDQSYTMKRESRAVPDTFPGKERLESLELVIIMDVSGSINFDDYNRFVNEIEKIARTVEQPSVRFIQFHSTVSMDVETPLNRVRNLGIPSTGGTVLKTPLDMLKKEDNRKMVVVFTDGHVDTDFKQDDYPFDVLMFVSSSGSRYVCDELRSRGFKTIHQDGENGWFVDA